MSTTGPFVTPTPTSPPTGPFVTPTPTSPPTGPISNPPNSSGPESVALPRFRLSVVREWATPVSILLLAASVAFYAFHEGGQGPGPASVDGVALGKSYVPDFLDAYATAWEVAAGRLADGKAVGESRKAMQDAWKEARIKAFSKKVAPALSRVLPEGTEPRDAEQRNDVVRLWRDFAKGLRKGK